MLSRKRKLFLLGLVGTLILPHFFLYAAGVKTKRAKSLQKAHADSVICDRRARETRNCTLKNGPYEFLLNKEKILIFDSFWRSLTDLPLKGEKTNWQWVEFRKLQNDFYLELEIWTEPFGETQVQNLRWFVFRAEKQKLIPLVDTIVQRRTPQTTKGHGYLYDPLEKHGLEIQNKEVKWRFRDRLESLREIKSAVAHESAPTDPHEHESAPHGQDSGATEKTQSDAATHH